jgi:hypothetical protein
MDGSPQDFFQAELNTSASGLREVPADADVHPLLPPERCASDNLDEVL